MTGAAPHAVVYTIGHSTRPLDVFLALLEREAIRELVDVRAFPVSRRHPHFNGDRLAAALRERGILYSHAPALGGRRPSRRDSSNTGLRNASFRGYADHMATAGFREALEQLIARSVSAPTTIMCAEAVPWRCHRSLIADALTARGCEVRHVLDATTNTHLLSPAAVVRDAIVTYPTPAAAPAAQQGLFEAR